LLIRPHRQRRRKKSFITSTPVYPLENVAHEVPDVGHEDEEKGDADESVYDAEHLTLARLRKDVTVTCGEFRKKLQS
jgi:hypothetical protein